MSSVLPFDYAKFVSFMRSFNVVAMPFTAACYGDYLLPYALHLLAD